MIRQSFNTNWFFKKETGLNPTQLQPIGPITLPHDAMLLEQRDPKTKNSHNTGFFPGGVYRYSKSFRVPQEWCGRSVTLEFEGVYMRSEVFVNGQLVGGRPSGYAIFYIELDNFLSYGSDNLVEVVAHNNDEPNSRWYSGSGIYRPVHLLLGDRLRVTPNGLRLTTKSIEKFAAVVEVATEILNDGPERHAVTVATRLTTASTSGTAIGPFEEQVCVEPGETKTVRQVLSVPAVKMWSPQSPHLYSATVQVLEGDQVLDEARTEFGIRTLILDPRFGLRINGNTVKLRGACIHHDNGVIGAHTLDAAEDRRIRILKESGFNAIRSAHNPLSRATLRACDRHGMLVMDELTDVWWHPKGNFDYSLEFEQWWERDMEALVAKDFNHPSVVMYSIGNEIMETATPRGITQNRVMADRIRELDPTRFVTNAINGFLNLISPLAGEKGSKKDKGNGKAAPTTESGKEADKKLIVVLNFFIGILEKSLKYIVRLPGVDKRTRDAFADLDIAGYNYISGRYGIDAKLYPKRVIVGSETAPTGTVVNWQEIERMPHVIGDFTWTGWDYIGEAGIGVIEYNQPRKLFQPYPALLAGESVIDITGHRQTQAYLNEIAWHLKTGPYIAVQPVNHSGEKQAPNAFRSTNSIRSWSWEGCEGRIATVEVYAAAHRVELLFNRDRIGTRLVGLKKGYLAKFTLPYRAGTLTAVAYDAIGQEIGRDTLNSAGPELQLHVRSESNQLLADGSDLAYIPIALTDAAGILRPLADRQVTVEVSGAGTLLGLGSAQPITEEGFSTTRHSTYWGRVLAVVRAGHEPGVVKVTVSTQDCEPQTITIPVEEKAGQGLGLISVGHEVISEAAAITVDHALVQAARPAAHKQL